PTAPRSNPGVHPPGPKGPSKWRRPRPAGATDAGLGMVPIPARSFFDGASRLRRPSHRSILRARGPPGERGSRVRESSPHASPLITLVPSPRAFNPWSGVVPSGESANPGGRAMAEETPTAPEPELNIGGEAAAKVPAR